MARPTKNYQEVLRSYPRSRKVNSLSIGAEMLYVRLLVLVDCEGRFPAEPAVLAGLALAERLGRGQVTAADVATWLEEIERVGLIDRYEVAGEPLLQLTNFFRNSNNRLVSIYPGPSGDRAGTTASPERGPSGVTPVPAVGTERGPSGDESGTLRAEQNRTEQPERAGARVVVRDVPEPDPAWPWPEWVDASKRDGWVRAIAEAAFPLVDVRSSCAFLDGVCQAVAQVTAPRPGEDELDRRVREGSLDVVGEVVAWLRPLDGRGRALATGALRKGPLGALWRHPRLERDDQANQQERERRNGGTRGKAR